ncbi:2-keto-4-pentenoate hydratase [Thioalkalivibrio sp. HK1]|uniref:2-keto-4-pentenoate hydratase n=1 Tax=Thioalkalivibrio sp. HK1 TaxID=1469245 RepID=UPI0012DD5088|nr:fumarylacetoacetate hydrolase family protein [Thioalkalivibrio sp. HK1]
MSDTPTDIDEAADLIVEGYERNAFFPIALQGRLSFDEALRLQIAVLNRRLERGDELAGWKIGLTSPSVRKRFGSDRQPFGYLLHQGLIPSGSEIDLDDIVVGAGIEPELCFVMGADLEGPGITPEQTRGAVAGVAPGMEINQRRDGGVLDFALSVADNLTQWAVVHGETIPLPAEFLSDDLVVRMERNGGLEASMVGRDVIDDHFSSIATLANILGEYGLALKSGQRLITGSFSKHDPARGDRWRASFDGIGSCEVAFRR